MPRLPTDLVPSPSAPSTRRLFLQFTSGGLMGLTLGCAKPVDATVGPTPDDSGSPPSDSGSPPSDSGSPPSDSGPRDTGWPGGRDSSSWSDTGGGADSQPPEDTGGANDSATPSICEETPDDIEGPFYVDGAPARSDLDLYSHEGIPLVFSGFLLDLDCQPIPDAVIEIWHADPEGAYDKESPQYRYRGFVQVGADGAYRFQTLAPGRYLNGATYRPRHIHVKIWVGGVEALVTQLYFEGDPYNASDPWYNPATELPVEKDAAGAITSTYDFVVET